MFRIHFNEETARWEIQFLRWGFLWSPVHEGRERVNFLTLAEAEAFVKERGIEEMYDRYVTKGQNAAYALKLVERREAVQV